MSKEHNDSFSFNIDPYHSFLQPLIGEVVQVYRGGPESNTGKIVDIQSDYVALLVQDEDSNDNNNNKKDDKDNQNSEDTEKEEEENQYVVIYYRTEHLQSIGENTMSNSMPRFQEEEDSEITFKTGTDFLNLVEQFSGEDVQINQGGPESKSGTLLEVSGNYMALLTEDDGVVFFNVHHIKSICLSNDDSDEDDGSEDEKQIPEYYKASTFHELFSKMNYKWVSINRGGPQALEGVLVVNGNGGGYYTLVNNDEVLRINPFHIKSISCGPKGALKSNQQNKSNDADNNKKSSSSNDKKSSSKSSSSKRSSSKHSSTKRSSSKRSSTKRSSTKRSSSKRSSTKRSSTKRSSTKRSSTKRSSTKRSSTKRSSSRRISNKRKSGKRRSSTRKDTDSRG